MHQPKPPRKSAYTFSNIAYTVLVQPLTQQPSFKKSP